MTYRDNIDRLARRITDRIPVKFKNGGVELAPDTGKLEYGTARLEEVVRNRHGEFICRWREKAEFFCKRV